MKSKGRIKTLLINSLMNSGEKQTSENLVLKSIKRLHKITKKPHKELVKGSIVKPSPMFKINSQKFKKGKRITVKKVPYIINKNKTRISESLRITRNVLKRSQQKHSFKTKWTNEIISILKTSKNSLALNNKKTLQNFIFFNKRYLSKFKWR